MVEVFNALLSYIVLVLFIAVLAGIAIFAGIWMRKRKNKKDAEAAALAALESATESVTDNE